MGSRYGPNVYDHAPKVAAYQPEVRRAVRRAAQTLEADASEILAQHRHQGHAQIYIQRSGPLDYLVGLSDERGLWAAAAIEFGTYKSEAVSPLQSAISVNGVNAATRRYYDIGAINARREARARARRRRGRG